jgi:hypothetical protein
MSLSIDQRTDDEPATKKSKKSEKKWAAGDIAGVFQGLESAKKRPISDSVVAQMGATFPYRLT